LPPAQGPEPRTGLATVILVDYYLQILHFDRRMPLNIDLGPLHIHLYARAVFFMWVTVAILVVGGIAVFASRRRELIQKWTTWVLIAPVVAVAFGGLLGDLSSQC